MNPVDEKSYSPGLAGVIAGITKISEIDPEHHYLAYRGYDIETLATQSNFEEVAYLLLYGDLPTASQYKDFCDTLVAERSIPEDLKKIFAQCPKGSPVMDLLRIGVTYLGLLDPDLNDNSREANYRKAARLTAKMGTLVAQSYQITQGLEVIEPRSDLSHAANLLYMITGREPDALSTRVFDASLILYAEHGYNASAFSARVTCSTLADMHAGVTSALAALKGPRHGGANEQAMEMMLEIGDPSKAEEWILRALAEKKRIPGFGHRIYKTGDTRVPIIMRLGEELAQAKGETKWTQMAEVIIQIMEREKSLHPNVDFPIGYVYYLLGIPIVLDTPIFAAARIVGWCAHIMEELEGRYIIRPDALYEGKRRQQYIPMSERG